MAGAIGAADPMPEADNEDEDDEGDRRAPRGQAPGGAKGGCAMNGDDAADSCGEDVDPDDKFCSECRGKL